MGGGVRSPGGVVTVDCGSSPRGGGCVVTIKELNRAVEGYVVEGGAQDSRVVLGFDAGRVMWMRWRDGFVGSSTLVWGTVTEVAVEDDTLCWCDGERWRLAYTGRFRRDDQAHE